MIALHDPAAGYLFRGLCIVAVVVSLAGYIRLQEWRPLCGRVFLFLSVALLFFPYAISVWSPVIAGEASWLYNQHEHLTAGSGDLYLAQEYKDAFWRLRLSLVDRPIDSEIHPLPDWGPTYFGWGRLIEMVEWFGLSAWFAAFLGKGWVFAVMGAPGVLAAIARDTPEPERGARFVRQGLTVFTLALTVALVPPGLASWFMMDARHAAQQGDAASALASLRRASWLMPSVREDGNFVLETGLLENTLGQETAASRHYRAGWLEEGGDEFEARVTYLAGIADPEASPALRRECAGALLRLGAKALNSGEVNGAVDLFETVMAFDPCNLRANYALQLTYLQQGDRLALMRLQARMTDTYRFLNTPTKAAVLAHGRENLAFNEYLRGDLSSALEAWKGARRH